jgi:ectoine hydroxylase-related dioxygenase (phytanoyl-CoA dioxygenase family)
MLEQFEARGFALLPGFLSNEVIEELTVAIEEAGASGPGTRNLLHRVPKLRHFAASPTIRDLVQPILGASAFAVKAILFNKSPEANWKVPWHQDLKIAVEQRIEVPGFGPWSRKEGVHHVQAPVELLDSILALRVHLDDCGEENGPLRVIPGSHRLGRLNVAQIESMQATSPTLSCELSRGGILLMRPLLLHASSTAVSPSQRRVIHLEFAATTLPGGLSWSL